MTRSRKRKAPDAARQLELALRPVRSGRGGARVGAGRPKAPRSTRRVSHATRPHHVFRHPVHVTLHAVQGVSFLQNGAFGDIESSLRGAATKRDDLRVVHFSVQGDHIHLLVEADDRTALSRGVQGLEIRIARRVNRRLQRRGRVFRDRYHAEVATSPRKTRNVLAYVLLNRNKHLAERGITPTGALDPHASAAFFNGFRALPARFSSACSRPFEPPVFAPRTWLLSSGWKRHGLIDPDEVPGSPASRAQHARARCTEAGMIRFAVFASTMLATVGAQAERTETRWYGWQTLAVDGASLAAFGLAAPKNVGPVLVGSVALFALGAPAIHVAHDRVGYGVASFAVRGAGLALLGGGLRAMPGKDAEPNDAPFYVAVAGGVVCLTAIPLDAFVFAREEVKPRSIQWSTTPWVAKESFGLTASGFF